MSNSFVNTYSFNLLETNTSCSIIIVSRDQQGKVWDVGHCHLLLVYIFTVNPLLKDIKS